MTDFRLRRAAALFGAIAITVAGLSGTASAQPAAPALTVDVASPLAGPGLILLAPKIEGGSSLPQGPEIVDARTGRVVWFDALPSGVQATDFREQTYRGRPVLTWWQGTSNNGAGHGEGVDYISDLDHHVIATVKASAGLAADQHEFRLTDSGTALITSYLQVPYDLSAYGGPKKGSVLDGIAEEIDVATGRLVSRWDSLAHVPLSDSYAPVPASASQPWDYFHINAVNPDTDGNLLISSRHTSTVYKVDRHTGAVLWRLGGKHSDFTLGPGVSFAWQHNPLPAGPNLLRIFDNENNGVVTPKPSRVIWVRLDPIRKTATLVRAFTHPDQLSAPSQGNAQALPGGDTFVNWGQLGRVSEFSPTGQLLFDATLPSGYDTYRAYKIPLL